MKLSRVGAATLSLSFFTPGFAQQQQPAIPKQNDKQADSTPAQKQRDVVKIGVTLVQVDVAAIDRKGRPVTDLKPEDFEIYEDGRRQQVTNFVYVSPESVGAPTAPIGKAKPTDKYNPPPPPGRLRPNDVRRTIALVVDDLTLTLESTPYVQQALKKFVDEQMLPGDLVAIVRTGAGMGALQMFTADKRILYAAIERVRWSPSSNTLYTFAPVATNVASPNRYSLLNENPFGGDIRNATGDPTTTLPERATDEMDKLRQEIFSIGTLGAVSFVVRALRELPGRKSVVLFSEGLRIYNREQNVIRVRDALATSPIWQTGPRR